MTQELMTQKQKKTQIIEWMVTGVLLILGLYNQFAQIKGLPHFEIGDAELTRYVTWFYELAVTAWAYWHNNNITTDSKISQLVLNALKNNTVTKKQVEEFLNNSIVKQVINAIIDKKVTSEQLSTLLSEDGLKEIADAHAQGKEVKVNIND